MLFQNLKKSSNIILGLGIRSLGIWNLRARSIQPKFQPVQLGKEDHLKRWTRFLETFRVGPNRSIEFWTEISGKFGWMDRAPSSPEKVLESINWNPEPTAFKPESKTVLDSLMRQNRAVKRGY